MNISALQKQLQGLPDQALAGYMMKPSAEVPQYLVLSELNRRKQLRQSAASMQAPQQAPRTTVADDVMGRGMMALPQQPAPEGYASGGLVSFASGGDVDSNFFQYDYGSPQQAQYTPEQVARIQAAQAAQAEAVRQRALQNAQVYGGPGVVNARGAAMGVYPTLVTQANRARQAQAAVPPASDVSGILGANTETPDYSNTDKPTPQLEPYNAQPLVAPGFTARAAAQANQGTPATATPLASQGPGATPGVGGLRSLSASTKSKTAGGVGGGKAPAGSADSVYKPLTDDERLASIDKMEKYFEDKNKGEFDPALQRLEAERQDIADRKNQNINEAMIQAGLGMMAGKSQYALQNIGEGGMQGLAYLNKANQQDDAARRALISEQNAITKAQSLARRGDQQSAVQYQSQAEKDRQFAVTAAQQRENYLLAHQDRMAQINATLQAASMRVAQGSGSKQDMLALKAAQMAEGSAKSWAMANKSNPEYVINPGKFEQDYQAKLTEGYTRAYAVIGREAPDAVQGPAKPQNPTISFGSLK